MGIEVLNNPDGFLFMVEGGKIDWAAHDNDAATVVNEIISFSDAVAAALEFYNKYPNETLIIVTADHETGGMSVGVKDNKYESYINLLSNQKHSLEMLNIVIRDFKEQHNGRPTFNQVVDFLASNEVMKLDLSELSSKQHEKLKAAHQASVAPQTDAQKQSNRENYGSAEPIAMASMQILNEMASIGWTTLSHTASHVPLYAIGANQELFSGQIDNTEIPRRIATAMGFSIDK
jgi:alkaline phosphatase